MTQRSGTAQLPTNAMDCPKCGKRQVRDRFGYYRCGVLLHERHYIEVERLHREMEAAR